jgi:3-hydroxyisobutyrate dehydrogenase-like beta-hydroxyacid dehydrogenase
MPRQVDATQRERRYDIKSVTDRSAILSRFSESGVQFCDSAQKVVQDADVILSLVTADQAEVAAQSAINIRQNSLYLDGNSCSPDTKRRNAEIVTRAGGRYVDLAIMAPVRPDLHNVSMLVAGKHAADAQRFLSNLGLRSNIVESETGAATSIKMIRSIAVKGLEAIVAECTIAAVRAGVDAQVFASLENSYPGFGWADRSATSWNG